MIHDLEDVKKMFKTADEIIQERPELLSMNVDEIFDELDDGTPEMIHNRWGVMTRVKITELTSFDNKSIIDFFVSIKEKNLLTEYIGYILQRDYRISLLSVLLDEYDMGLHNEVLPFVEVCLEYEQNSFIEKIDDILDIIADIDNSKRYQFVQGYVFLLIKTEKEEIVLKKYVDNYSNSLEQLVSQVGSELYQRKNIEAGKWLDIYINEEAKHCKKMSVHFLYRSLFNDCNAFEEQFRLLEEKFCNVQELWEDLIPVYVQYMSYKDKGRYIEECKKRLISIRNGKLNEKTICIQAMHYRIQKLEEYCEITESIISVSFGKDKQILQGLDSYLDYKFKTDSSKTLNLLYNIYVKNGYGNRDQFLELLPQTCQAMNQCQKDILDVWWDKFWHGSSAEFLLSVEIFSKVIVLDKLDEFLEKLSASKKDLLCLLEGIYLFTIDEKKIANLVFLISSYMKDREYFLQYCIKNIFSNYSGALLEAAQRYRENDDVYKSNLATDIIEYFESCKEKIQKGYEDKDFMPPTDRKIIYDRAMLEQNKKIHKQAEEHSVIASLFPSRKMKYGSRFALIQMHKKGKLHYSVSEYAKQSFSMELPKVFVNDPIKYIYMRMDYLEKRGTNEVNN